MTSSPLFDRTALALLGLAVVAGALRLWPFAALLAVAWAGAVVLAGIRSAGRQTADDLVSLSPEARSRVRPILDRRSELRALVDRHADLPAVAVVGREALAEANRIVEEAVRLVGLRRTLQEAAAADPSAGQTLADVDARLAAFADGLTEVKSRLAVAAARGRTSAPDAAEADDLVARLRALSASADEAADTLHQTNR